MLTRPGSADRHQAFTQFVKRMTEAMEKLLGAARPHYQLHC
jgi:hypothetical protein